MCWFQVPTASITVEGNPALNRVRWANSGREIAVGDSEGRVFVYDVGEVSRQHYVSHCVFSNPNHLSMLFKTVEFFKAAIICTGVNNSTT